MQCGPFCKNRHTIVPGPTVTPQPKCALSRPPKHRSASQISAEIQSAVDSVRLFGSAKPALGWPHGTVVHSELLHQNHLEGISLLLIANMLEEPFAWWALALRSCCF